MPGLFVRIRLPFTRGRSVVVPDEIVSVDQGGRYVLVVDDTDTVQHRRVQTGALVDGQRVIADGLKPEDRVVVNGLQRARPGIKVKTIAGAPTATASAEPPP